MLNGLVHAHSGLRWVALLLLVLAIFNALASKGKNSYEKKDKVTGQPLKTEDIVKGYQYEPGQYVIVEQEDLNKVKLKSEKVIEIEGFVTSNEVHHTLFETPYFVGSYA